MVASTTTPKTRSLSDYRADTKRRKIESIGTPGLNFDNSPPGSGKSHSDMAAAEVAGKSMIVGPTHKNTKEDAERFNAGGLHAEAFPEINKKTCADYDNAIVAINSGLSVSSAVCPSCRFSSGCGYRIALEEAEAAPHSMVTHRRYQLSSHQLSKGKKFISIHESCVNLLRPVQEIAIGFDQVVVVAESAGNAAWNKQNMDARYFCYRLATAARGIRERLLHGAGTEPIDMPPPAGAPPGIDATLFHAMTHTRNFPPAEAMQICYGMVTGDLSELMIREDKIFTRGGKLQVKRSVIGVWKTELSDSATIWFSDATGDCEEIEFLAGRPVVDQTPEGQLAQQHQPIQVAHLDIKKSTKSRTVVKILRALFMAFPQYRRVGVLIDKIHVPIVKGTARKGLNLDRCFRYRVVKVEWFRSGDSRGSNAWMTECDAVFVAGSPRVPPSAVRTRLIQTGRPPAAARDGKWEIDHWSGIDLNGRRHTIRALGFRDHDWCQAHRSLVRSELLQSVGRGRGILENGVFVMVVSSEDLGLPLATVNVQPLSDSAMKVHSDAVGRGKEGTPMTSHDISWAVLVGRPDGTQEVESAGMTRREAEDRCKYDLGGWWRNRGTPMSCFIDIADAWAVPEIELVMPKEVS